MNDAANDKANDVVTDGMLVLGIETSCDETAAAVVRGGRAVLSNIIASQIDLHQPYGGVVPEIAARRHIECIGPTVDEALAQAGVTLPEIDAYAVANGPGLAGALLVGLSYAKALAYAQRKPIVGVQHIEGHICANYLGCSLEPPFLSLVVSGGHTLLLAVRDYQTYEILGRTRDDAAGEAFDKAARTLGLPYPGGPHIDRLAAVGNGEAVHFPRAKLESGSLDFSFSGLKSAVRQYMERSQKELSQVKSSQVSLSRTVRSTSGYSQDVSLADIAASFQKAVIDVLVSNTLQAAARTGFTNVALAGGVAANKGLRNAMQAACTENGLHLHMPDTVFCTDNAAMIAGRGYYALASGAVDGFGLNAYPGRMGANRS